MSRKAAFNLVAAVVMVVFLVLFIWAWKVNYHDMTSKGCTYNPWLKTWTCPMTTGPTTPGVKPTRN